ncbi:MAG: hypothetical protein ACYDGY_08965 [Acidimicrobiales bacterium]
MKERRLVELVDLPASGRPACLVWHKRRFRCPESHKDHSVAPNKHPLRLTCYRWTPLKSEVPLNNNCSNAARLFDG